MAWGNGPTPSDFQSKDVPNTVIHVSDTFDSRMQHFHVRVPAGLDDWSTYVKWRDVKLSVKGTAQDVKVHGIGLDEIFPNTTVLSALYAKIDNVDWWCDSIGLARPQWVIALTAGNTAAVDAVLHGLNDRYPGRVWWFPECYIGMYKGEAEDYGTGNAHMLLDRIVQAGLHSRAIYGINHSHYTVQGQLPAATYYNVYGTAPDVGNSLILDRLTQVVFDVVNREAPFGFGLWTPGYSSPLIRGQVGSLLTAVGC